MVLKSVFKLFFCYFVIFSLLVFVSNVSSDEDESNPESSSVESADTDEPSGRLEPDKSEEHSFEEIIEKIDRTVIYNENSNTRYFKVHLVIDYSAFKLLNSDEDNARVWAIKLIYLVDALWQHANLRVYLTVLDILSNPDENLIRLDPKTDTIKNVLVKFRDYIDRTKTDADFHDFLSASILITASGWSDNTTKGRASNAPCSVGGVAVIEFNEKAESIAYLFGHELGHVFNMKHPEDYGDKKCVCEKPDSQGCVVATGYKFNAKEEPKFTVCDINVLNSAELTCIINPPKLFVSSKCGNGILEPGEDCDCGRDGICPNSCCNSTTCTLKENADCAFGPCCHECKYKSKGIVCRMQNNECDWPEFCTGDTEWCPEDLHKPNGFTCQKKTAFCWDGECQQREQQCKRIWGPYAQKAASGAYDLNKGLDIPPLLANNTFINCGWDDENQKGITCTDENKLCGELYCKLTPNSKRKSIYAPLGYTTIGSVYAVYHKIFPNSTFGKVNQGTACTKSGKEDTDEPRGMCVKRKNLHVCDYNLTSYYPKSCESSNGVLCGGSNNGHCNQYGRCVCKEGFDPAKNCAEPLTSSSNTTFLKCFSCVQGAYCNTIVKRSTKTVTCPRSDMVCYSTRFKYEYNPSYSYVRGCMTKEKCVPGCVWERFVQKCTTCCNESNCNSGKYD